MALGRFRVRDPRTVDVGVTMVITLELTGSDVNDVNQSIYNQQQ